MYDEEIEKAVLYYMIFEGKDFNISTNDFMTNRNRQIAEAIIQLKSEKKDISLLSIAGKIKGNQSEVLSYISKFSEYVFGTSEELVFNRLIDYSKKRQLYELLKKTEKEIQESSEIDVFIEKMINSLSKIQSRNERRYFKHNSNRRGAI